MLSLHDNSFNTLLIKLLNFLQGSCFTASMVATPLDFQPYQTVHSMPACIYDVRSNNYPQRCSASIYLDENFGWQNFVGPSLERMCRLRMTVTTSGYLCSYVDSLSTSCSALVPEYDVQVYHQRLSRAFDVNLIFL